jgi:hypothetical protein
VQGLHGHWNGDERKVRIAARLRRETARTLALLAERLHMRAPGRVAYLLCRSSQDAEVSEYKLSEPTWNSFSCAPACA